MHRDNIGAGKRFMQFQKFNVGIHRPVSDIGVYGDHMPEKRPHFTVQIPGNVSKTNKADRAVFQSQHWAQSVHLEIPVH